MTTIMTEAMIVAAILALALGKYKSVIWVGRSRRKGGEDRVPSTNITGKH
jgi:hypothetical protein